MDLAFPLVAFAVALAGTFRSLGWGLAGVIAVGYLNGVVRANFLGVLSTFMFDAAVLGLYVGIFAFHSRRFTGATDSTVGKFIFFLILWPTVMAAMPVNHFLVQFVALRGTVWFLPVCLIATRLTTDELDQLGTALATLNLFALAVALYEFQVGIQAVFPQNVITEVMYRSGDVAGYTAYRIPSTFLNAHSYGGTMLLSLPFLADRLFSRRSRLLVRILATAGIAAAIGGILLCAARSPIVVLSVAIIVSWAVSRFSLAFGLAVAGLLTGGILLALTSERLQRAATLDDTEFVSERIGGSMNTGFLDILIEYPLGAGMGSSVGTSIPFFLAAHAPEQVGLENEFSRIVVDQGWIGLGLWLAFIAWLLGSAPPPRFAVPWQLGRVLMYSLALATWGTAFIGTGTLSSIPGSVMLLTMMGVLARARERPTRARR